VKQRDRLFDAIVSINISEDFIAFAAAPQDSPLRRERSRGN
jgi:hypothetical protein